MVKLVSEVHSKKIILTKGVNPTLRLMGHKIGIVNKVSGNLVYEKSINEYRVNYRVGDLRQSIRATEEI